MATASQGVRARPAPEMVPIEHETSDRVVRTIVFLAPPAALALGGWLAWGGALHWQDLVVLAITYTLTGLGITVGYHRLFTHRSFKTTRTVRALLAVLGSMAVEGPVIEWVATHRKHHRFSDQRGRPAQPPRRTMRRGGAARCAGSAHAHVGWMFRGKDMANPGRYAKDLLADRDLRFISRTFPLWVVVGLALPFGAGRGADRLARGRAHRTAVGRSGARLPPAPRDLQHQLALPLLRPATVRHRRRVAQPRLAGAARLRRGLAQQPPRLSDLRPPRPAAAGSSIPAPGSSAALERCRLAWDVVRITPERQLKKAVGRLVDRKPRLVLLGLILALASAVGHQSRVPVQAARRGARAADPGSPSGAQRRRPLSLEVVPGRLARGDRGLGPARRCALARAAVDRAGGALRRARVPRRLRRALLRLSARTAAMGRRHDHRGRAGGHRADRRRRRRPGARLTGGADRRRGRDLRDRRRAHQDLDPPPCPPRAEGLLLGAAAGALFGVSDVAIKWLTQADPGPLLGLLSPWTLTALVAGVISFFASARSLQIGEAVEVIAITSVAANLAAIIGGIIVFHEPIGSGPAEIGARCLAFCLVIAGAALMPAPMRAAPDADYGVATAGLEEPAGAV